MSGLCTLSESRRLVGSMANGDEDTLCSLRYLNAVLSKVQRDDDDRHVTQCRSFYRTKLENASGICKFSLYTHRKPVQTLLVFSMAL